MDPANPSAWPPKKVGPNWGTITTPVASTANEPRAPIHAKMALTPKA